MECRSCRTDNPQQARYCLACGAPLAGLPVAPREERKVVSVLFADLVGFTDQAERLDPEDVEALLAPYHAQLRSELERYGGTVEKFIGDAVMAVFGAPATHEDDAERAVRAALAIRDWAREQRGPELRIAVNTGEALVSLDARPEQGEAMVKGDVVNTAARLQSAAPVNGILVGGTTFRATQRVIDYRRLEPIAAKGKTQPVPVWEAIEARSRFGVDVRQIGRAPLVGREAELRALVDALDRAGTDRTAQLVTLVGVPGIGKSRLVWELFQRVEEGPNLVAWRQGRSLPYGEGVSFWALGEIVKAQAGILESDGAEAAEEKLGAALTGLLGNDAQRPWLEGHLRPLVGLGAGLELGSERRAEAFAAWRRFLEALAEQRPTVLVFEDLHWADEGMLDFVDHLAERSSGVPLLLLATARPELLARRPDWGGGKANSITFSLSPLSGEETTQLVHELLGEPLLAAETQQALLERAGGNPLYAEEFARLAEEGGLQQALPESVQAIIAARLDALTFEQKTLIQQAAVLGKVFWPAGLAAVSGQSRWAVEEGLYALERGQFVRRERSSSVGAETEYAFRHALVREVAYEQLPRARRAAYHRQAAAWIESLGRLEDTAEMLAHHYLSAIEYARAGGASTAELAEPARAAIRAAGERALSLNSFRSAQRFFAAALEITPADQPQHPLLVFGHARALHATGEPEATQALEEAVGRLIAASDHERAAEAEVMIAELAWHAGNRARVDEHLANAQSLVVGAPRTPSRARVMSELSRYLMLAGKYDQAIEVGREALALARELSLPEVEAHALNNTGVARALAGDEGGIADLERSIEIGLSLNSPEVARGYNNLSAILWEFGLDTQRSYELRCEAMATDRRFGRHRISRFAEGTLIQFDYFLGRWDEFLQRAERYIAAGDSLGRSYQDLYMWAHRAAILLARGDEERALEHARIGAELARQAGDPQAVIPALSQLARVEAELGLLDDAREHGQELLDTAASHAGTELVFELTLAAEELGLSERILSVLASLPASSRWGAIEQAILEGDFLAAAEALSEMNLPPLEASVRLKAAERLVREGRRREADAELARALEFWRRVGATRYIQQAESLMSASA